MVTDALLAMVATLLGWVDSIRPAWSMTLPEGAVGFISSVRAWNAYLPVTELLACAGLTCTVVVALQAWKWTIKIADWVADVLP